MLHIQKIIKKIEHIKTAQESIDILINEYNDDVLKPIATYLQEQRQKTASELADEKELMNIQVVSEQIQRLSHF